MSFKKLKKIFCGLLASTGMFSSSISSKAANSEKLDALVQNLKETDNKDLNSGRENSPDGSTWKRTLKTLGVLPVNYTPNENVKPLDLHSSGRIETDRLLIQKLTDEEVPSLLPIYDEYVYRRISSTGCTGAPFTEKSKLTSVQQYASNENAFSYIIKEKTHETPVGEVTVYFYEDEGRFELSYWFGKESRGKGYASEVIPALCKRMFVRDDVNALSFRILDDNIPSIKIKDKSFNGLKNLYSNQVLNTSVEEDLSTTRKIHVYKISKFKFDFNELVNSGTMIDIDSGIQMIKKLIAKWKNKKSVPDDIKDKMSQILDKLTKEKEKNPLSFIMMLDMDRNIQISVLNSSDSEMLFYDAPNVQDHLPVSFYFDISKHLLCGSTLKKVELKFHERLKTPTIVEDLKNCLQNDASKKILNLTSEKDDKGVEHIYLSKK